MPGGDAPGDMSTLATLPYGTNEVVGSVTLVGADVYHYYYDGSSSPLTIETNIDGGASILTLFNSAQQQIYQNSKHGVGMSCAGISGVSLGSTKESCITATLSAGFYFIQIEASVLGFDYQIYISVPANPPPGVSVSCGTPRPTPLPTKPPTNKPTPLPTLSPTPPPTKLPTTQPTSAPSKKPTPSPTKKPTPSPTAKPTTSPTKQPTKQQYLLLPNLRHLQLTNHHHRLPQNRPHRTRYRPRNQQYLPPRIQHRLPQRSNRYQHCEIIPHHHLP